VKGADLSMGKTKYHHILSELQLDPKYKRSVRLSVTLIRDILAAEQSWISREMRKEGYFDDCTKEYEALVTSDDFVAKVMGELIYNDPEFARWTGIPDIELIRTVVDVAEELGIYEVTREQGGSQLRGRFENARN